MLPREQRYAAILFLALAALCWSTAGLFTRLIPLDAWTILFWRGAFGALLTGLCALCLDRRDRATAPRFQLGHGTILVWMTLGTLAFIPALKLTGVASVAIIHATTPLIAAGLAWIWLGEPIERITVVAGAVAAAGVAIMGSGRPIASDGLGMILAFGMAFSMAMTLVAFRRHRDVACWPVACLSNVLTAAVAAPFAHPVPIGTDALAWLMLFSLVQMTLGLGLFVLGTRRLPAAEAAVIGLIETPLAPFWVWLVFYEIPSVRTMIGGALVLTATATHLVLRRGRWRAAAAGADGRAGAP
ncbi:MAG: DMT family transporter [Dongiaceae bacterium]